MGRIVGEAGGHGAVERVGDGRGSSASAMVTGPSAAMQVAHASRIRFDRRVA